MRRQALDDEVIKHILDLIDENNYTQRELAERYGVTQGTISRYNRVKRLQFKVEDDVKLIAKLNLEVLDLKKKLGYDTTEELAVPDSFYNAKISIKIEDKKYKRISCFYSHNHADCIKYLNRHPEFYMYTAVSDPKLCDGNRIAQFIRSRARNNVCGYIITAENLGKITAKNQLQIKLLEIG